MTLLKSFKNEIILLLFTGFIVVSVIIFNDVNRYIRIKEMKISLQKNNRTDNNVDHVNLIMRYNLQKKIYEKRISQDEADIFEMKVNSMITSQDMDKRLVFEKYKYIAPPTLFMVNTIRKILSKPEIIDLNEEEFNAYLEIAYYYERNKLYDKALKQYEKALEEDVDREIEASIYLHQGFCYSIIGNYERARGKYKEVINNYSDLSLSITAAILLRYIEGFRSEVERVLKDEKNSVEKGEKLYNLIAYKEAVEVLDKAEEDIKPEEKSKFLFYKARCMEELEKKEEAVNTYQELMKTDQKSEFAKFANRRIYMIGSSAQNGESIKEQALKNNELFKDEVLSKMDEISNTLKVEEESIIQESSPYKEAFKEQISEEPVLKAENIQLQDLVETVKKETPDKHVRKVIKKPEQFRIHTNDGNIFKGTLIKETDDTIQLKGIMGEVTIKKDSIIKREVVNTE